MIIETKWNGNADLANKYYGESYGYDWEYVSKKSSNIIINDKVIYVGQIM